MSVFNILIAVCNGVHVALVRRACVSVCVCVWVSDWLCVSNKMCSYNWCRPNRSSGRCAAKRSDMLSKHIICASHTHRDIHTTNAIADTRTHIMHYKGELHFCLCFYFAAYVHVVCCAALLIDFLVLSRRWLKWHNACGMFYYIQFTPYCSNEIRMCAFGRRLSPVWIDFESRTIHCHGHCPFLRYN